MFLLYCVLPDRLFYNFKASKSVDREALCCSETPIDGFSGSKTVKRSVGYGRYLFLRICWLSFQRERVCVLSRCVLLDKQEIGTSFSDGVRIYIYQTPFFYRHRPVEQNIADVICLFFSRAFLLDWRYRYKYKIFVGRHSHSTCKPQLQPIFLLSIFYRIQIFKSYVFSAKLSPDNKSFFLTLRKTYFLECKCFLTRFS